MFHFLPKNNDGNLAINPNDPQWVHIEAQSLEGAFSKLKPTHQALIKRTIGAQNLQSFISETCCEDVGFVLCNDVDWEAMNE